MKCANTLCAKKAVPKKVDGKQKNLPTYEDLIHHWHITLYYEVACGLKKEFKQIFALYQGL